MFKLEFDTDNAAFDSASGVMQPSGSGVQTLSVTAFGNIEAACILRNIAERVERGESDGIIQDINGNTIGRYKFMDS